MIHFLNFWFLQWNQICLHWLNHFWSKNIKKNDKGLFNLDRGIIQVALFSFELGPARLQL